MLDEQKKLIQEQHRLEQAQMRNRSKEQKARTRRLIQEGTILEKVFPWVKNVEDDIACLLCHHGHRLVHSDAAVGVGLMIACPCASCKHQRR